MLCSKLLYSHTYILHNRHIAVSGLPFSILLRHLCIGKALDQRGVSGRAVNKSG